MLIPAVLTTMGGARDIDGVAGNVMNVDADVGDIFEGDYDGLSAPSCENSCVEPLKFSYIDFNCSKIMINKKPLSTRQSPSLAPPVQCSPGLHSVIMP